MSLPVSVLATVAKLAMGKIIAVARLEAALVIQKTPRHRLLGKGTHISFQCTPCGASGNFQMAPTIRQAMVAPRMPKTDPAG